MPGINYDEGRGIVFSEAQSSKDIEQLNNFSPNVLEQAQHVSLLC